MGEITASEITFGRRYSDDSGYEWRVSLTYQREHGRRVEIEAPHDLNDPSMVKEIADALQQIVQLMVRQP